MPRVLKNKDPNDELEGLTIADIKTQYKKLKSKYDREHSQYDCHWCDSRLSSDKFYLSDKWASGLIPICRSCLNKIALGYNEKTGKNSETEETFRKALQLADLPFLRKEYNSAIDMVTNTTNGALRTSSFQCYMGMIQSLPQYKEMGYTHSDLEADGEVEEGKEIKLSKEKKKTAIRRFGSGYSDGAYLFLQNEYDDWVARYTIESKAQEDLLIEICRVKFKLHEADINGMDTKDLIKSYQDLMASLNVRPDKKDAKGIADAKSLGQMIEMWEEHDPIPEPDDDFKDVDKIGFYIDTFFKGHLSKMMGLKGAFSSMYERFMDKYTVKKQVYKDGKTSEEMFEQIFGSVGDKDG